jgi:hypothetical protein
LPTGRTYVSVTHYLSVWHSDDFAATCLDNAHKRLDDAVFAAYGWPTEMTGEGILERLLALNHSRAAVTA